jgi:putative addiction module component (TIGR02574 family)
MSPADDALNMLLSRPVDERARAARALLESLDDAGDEDAVAQAQATELVRRMQAFQSGEVKLLDHDEVRRRISERLRALRAQ